MNGKKTIFVLAVMALCSAAAVSAQGWGMGWGMMPGFGHMGWSPPLVEKMTLKGNLVASEGRIALRADGVTYYVRGIQGLIGFVDGLKEGASVEIEGGVQKRPASPQGTETVNVIYAEKLTLGGKVYDKLNQGGPGLAVSPPGFSGDRRHTRRFR
jgi:hypothetical protein